MNKQGPDEQTNNVWTDQPEKIEPSLDMETVCIHATMSASNNQQQQQATAAAVAAYLQTVESRETRRREARRKVAEARQEHKDAMQLAAWRRSCPPSVAAYLDRELPGWREEPDDE
jgi:hypothetical protein